MITPLAIRTYCYRNKIRWNKYEPIIARDVWNSYYYAQNAIKGRFELGETIISKDAYYSFYYAKNILKKRFQLGEKSIKTFELCNIYEENFNCKL
jgi:hypothetical protein